MLKLVAFLSALAITVSYATPNVNNAKILCYYDSSSFVKEGLGEFTIDDLELVASLCSHLVYGYAPIQPVTNELSYKYLNQEKANFLKLTSLKTKFPGIKVMLSIGGNKDDNKNGYLTLLETFAARTAFLESVYSAISKYNFDGLDLAWQFPPNKPEKLNRMGIKNFKAKFEQHKEQFISLIRELKEAFKPKKLLLSVTVLPNVDAATFYDPVIIKSLEYVNIAGYDFQTPERNPNIADFPSPIYDLTDRRPGESINSLVQYWLSQHVPATKIIIGIAPYGRSWKMTTKSGVSGIPPIIETDGPGPAGPDSQIEGLLSYSEICTKFESLSNEDLKGEDAPLTPVVDPKRHDGSYTYRAPDGNGNFGMWVAYEDPNTARYKAEYVKKMGLGGISISDLSFDDFRGTCNGVKFPLLRAVKTSLKL